MLAACLALTGWATAQPKPIEQQGQSGDADVAASQANDKSVGMKFLRDFGAKGDGVTDDTVAIRRAFGWLARGDRTLYGEPGKTYVVSDKLSVWGTRILFDCQQCIIKNAINAAVADPLFSLTDTSSNFIRLANFAVQFDKPTGKGHTIAIMGSGNAPQAIDLENIRINFQVGKGKDHNGAPMPAYGVYAYGVYTLNVDRLYIKNGSGGLFFDTLQKVSVTRAVVDSVTNFGMAFENVVNAEVGGMSNVTGSGQNNQADVYFNGCDSFTFRDSRIKGGAGAQIMAGDTPSRNVNIDSNHIEVYNPNHRAIYLKANTVSAAVTNNFIKHIGGNGPFDASIAVVEGPGAPLHGAFLIRHNIIGVGGADILANGILIRTSRDPVNSAVIESNTLGDQTVSATITNAINLAMVGSRNVVRNNIVGSRNMTVTNGIVVGPRNVGTVVQNNVVGGGIVKTLLENTGTNTRLYESGAWTPILKGETTAGVHSYRQQVGSYRRIDDVVYFTADVALSALDRQVAGNVILDGLPYVATGASGGYGTANVAAARFTFPANTTMVGAFVQPGTTKIGFSFSGTNTTPVRATGANLSSDFTVTVSGFYFAK
ncbi:glycosyl hydrolase family 28-related protein [Massilia sp. CT11-108]